MKERPILFSAPMVRALLAGTKTQTRRVIKKATGPSLRVGYVDGIGAELSWLHGDGPGHEVEERVLYVNCPYGLPADRLWVKETWRAPTSCDHLPPRSISDTEPLRFVADEFVGADAGFGKARPSIFMPRWASRITLEVIDVRVERLKDINARDAWAEGIPHSPDVNPWHEYGELWESINGAGSWDANPWVWVVEFKRLP